MSQVVYHFHLANGVEVSLPMRSDTVASADLPAWTGLTFHQCPNCPLEADNTPHCPMALSFVPLVAVAKALPSFEPVTVVVDSAERSVTKRTTVQRAIGSAMGLLAATSGCPRTSFLQPMAHFHLPFSTEDETVFRSVSSYLLSQYFAAQSGAEPNWTLSGLKTHYVALGQVNAAMAERLRSIVGEDGAINGFIMLDLLAKAMPYSIDEQLEEIAAHFTPATFSG